MNLDLPDFKDIKSFTVGMRELIYSFSAVYPTSKIAEIVFTQPGSVTAKRHPHGRISALWRIAEINQGAILDAGIAASGQKENSPGK